MRSVTAFVIGVLALSGVAYAQPPAPTAGYVEAVAQSAFGNVTSQSYGAEVGVTVLEPLQVFMEVGRVQNAAPSSLSDGALLIAGFLSQTQSAVAYSAQEPVTFVLFGVRYPFSPFGKLEPYVLGGAGFGRATKKVTFVVAGTDITNTIANYGVVLGSDLTGQQTTGMLSFGGGVVWPVRQRIIVDLQYRFGRVLVSDGGINVNRVGLGLGVRF
jgi:opacity protein-like surface antigen